MPRTEISKRSHLDRSTSGGREKGGLGSSDRFLDELTGSAGLVDYLLLRLFVNRSHAGQSDAKRKKLLGAIGWRCSGREPVLRTTIVNVVWGLIVQ